MDKFITTIKKAIPLRAHVVKAVIFGAAWFFLPFWIFFLIALYMYFVPFFRPIKLLLPFAVLIFFSIAEPAGLPFAVLLSLVFYLILGIKDLIFIGRKSAHEILVLAIMFLTFIKFFAKFDNWGTVAGFVWMIVIAAVFFFLINEFLRFADRPDSSGGARIPPSIIAGISAIIIWQISLVALLLPINFFYQSALVFLTATMLMELAADYSAGILIKDKVLISFSIFFSFLVVILGLAQWGL
ncbi:MAG: hypothetical protein KGJ89_00930 [Patescibacteria group bacterium]|nr:hypothetical protein [Patescibacteria group bacterium]MDE2015077.1 hypothetical protein [Patescibacteria group bacterium]MDE2226505.1 hypothetical protein [Patescibacteria group bacterium]